MVGLGWSDWYEKGLGQGLYRGGNEGDISRPFRNE